MVWQRELRQKGAENPSWAVWICQLPDPYDCYQSVFSYLRAGNSGKPMVQNYKIISDETLEHLAKFDTPLVSNAIERVNVRLRNEGFMNSAVKCQFPQMSPRVGYAVTGRIKTSSTPFEGRCYYENMDWWRYLESAPPPRFIVLQDADHSVGTGAFIGEIHASIAAALHCTACVTNGTVRDLDGVESAGLQMFCSGVSVSHAYAHITSLGTPVEVGGLMVKPGDLLHGDKHGVQQIPLSIAEKIPAIAQEILDFEKELLEFCKSRRFSVDGLEKMIERGRTVNNCLPGGVNSRPQDE
jgi:4-hydroxy-4-methyl-2-oxoglutarate aldolase